MRVALTFDDGPNTVTTPKLLDVLEKYKVPASFFLVGHNIIEDCFPVMVTEMADTVFFQKISRRV